MAYFLNAELPPWLVVLLALGAIFQMSSYVVANCNQDQYRTLWLSIATTPRVIQHTPGIFELRIPHEVEVTVVEAIEEHHLYEGLGDVQATHLHVNAGIFDAHAFVNAAYRYFLSSNIDYASSRVAGAERGR